MTDRHVYQVRRDTAANWTTYNPVLALAEPGLETDTRKVKYGDGATAWNDLAYASGLKGDTGAPGPVGPATTTPPPPTAPSLSAGWSIFASDWAPPRYYVGLQSLITIQGLIKGGADGVVFNLPAGCRPDKNIMFVIKTNSGFASLYVQPNGAVVVSGSDATWTALDGVSFYATA